jgi:hypothetical protein
MKCPCLGGVLRYKKKKVLFSNFLITKNNTFVFVCRVCGLICVLHMTYSTLSSGLAI